MGRSVSYPSGAAQVVYADASDIEDSDDFSWHVESLQEAGKLLFKSMSDCDDWVGREDRAVLENRLARIGVSEYCGLVAVWALPKTDDYGNDNPLAIRWAETINLAPLAECFGRRLTRLGTFSNGEGVYQRAAS